MIFFHIRSVSRVKKALCLILCLCCLFCSVGAWANTYPAEMDLTDLYESEEAVQADFARAMEMCLGLDAYRGRLKNPAVMAEIDEYTTLASRIMDRLRVYTNLLYSLDPSDPVALNLSAQFTDLTAAFADHYGFFDAELAQWTPEERLAVFTSPEMAPYAYAYRQYTDPDYQPLSEDEAKVLGLMAGTMNSVQNAYDSLSYLELPTAFFIGDNDKRVELTDDKYSLIYSMRYYSGDRDGALALEDAQNAPYGDLIHTFAALLQARASYFWTLARLEGYESTLACQLDLSDVPPLVHDLLCQAFHEGENALHAYVDAHLAAQGLDVGEGILTDVMMPLSDYYREYSFDQCVDTVRDILSVLGPEYISHYDRLVTSGHIDVYPAPNKVDGSFETACSDPDIAPYIMLNFTGSHGDLAVFAHEAGHAIYDMFAAENQWYGYSAPDIFTQEVASTVNQILVNLYMLDHARDADERLYFLEQLISDFVNTYFYQMIISEFEDRVYSTVESGGALNAESLSQAYLDINQRVFGDVRLADGSRYEWPSISHIYESPYYVFQYASSITYAADIALSIYRNDPGAAEQYISFLKAGASMGPEELLAIVGVAITDEATYRRAVSIFSGWVDEFTKLVQ